TGWQKSRTRGTPSNMYDEAGMRETLALLATEVEAVNQNLAAENVKRDARIAASEKVQHQNRRLAIVGGIIALLAVIAAGIGIGVAVQAHHTASDTQAALDKANAALVAVCNNGNEVRSEVTGLVGDLLQNSERTARATLASPTATPDQKAAAARNLEQVHLAEQKAGERLAQKDC